MMIMTMKLLSLVLAAQLLCVTRAFVSPSALSDIRPCRDVSSSSSLLIRQAAKNNKKDDNNDNDNNDNDTPLDWIQPEDNMMMSSSSSEETTPKLGIDLGAMLEPLSDEEAADLKAAATEIINDAIAEGLDEIDKVRERMNREFAKKRESMAAQSEYKTKQEAAKLLNKIDALTDAFLESNAALRKSTQLAAAADQAMEGKGLDIGAWGMLGGAAVTTGGGGLLGSVSQAQKQQQQDSSTKKDDDDSSTTTTATATENRIFILADESQDPCAKALIPALTKQLQKDILLPGGGVVVVDVAKPTATLPLGANNAACLILFCTSLSDRTSVAKALDRLLRKTLGEGGQVGQPPTQLVAISTLGTTRTNKLPYSWQNMMGGGKLDQRRQMEEAVISAVTNNYGDTSLDYTICKVGEFKDNTNDEFALEPGDVLDGTTTVDTAATILTHAIALQPAARNATLCIAGNLAKGGAETELLLDDAFLKLDGPELWRTKLPLAATDLFDSLAEYTLEWATLLADSGKGLTTPIRAQVSTIRQLPRGIAQAAGVQILFLPTATGKNYLSKDEERVRESQDGGKRARAPVLRKMAKEGGIEVLVEITSAGALRVRAKRCNYADDAVVKEISEDTILSRLKDSIEVWQKEQTE